jgi:hypothetical protein
VSTSSERNVTRAPEGREPVSAREGAPVGDPYGQAPPLGEEIHIPGPTIVPFICAIGITLLVVGTTIDPIFSWVGVAITVITLAVWVRDTRRDVSALPEEHH